MGEGGMASKPSEPQSNRKSVVYIGGVDEVWKELASEYCSIGKATEEILEKHQPGDPGKLDFINTNSIKRCLL